MADPRFGSLVYEAPGGSVVTVNFASDFDCTSDHLITGTTVGG